MYCSKASNTKYKQSCIYNWKQAKCIPVKKPMLFCLMAALCSFLTAQTDTTLNRLNRDLDYLLNGGKVYSLFDVIKGKSFELKNVLNITRPYCQIDHSELQMELADLYTDLGMYTQDSIVKTQVIHQLLSFCHDSMRLNYGCYNAVSGLQKFEVKYFDHIARKKIIDKFTCSNFDPDLILIAGMLDLKELIPKFKSLVSNENPDFSKTPRMALARMGDKAAIQYFIKQFNANGLLLNLRQLELLAYIRQPETIRVFSDLLFSTKSLPDDPCTGAEAYASFGLYHLSQSLEAFPVKTQKDVRSWKDGDLQKARQWMIQYTGRYKIVRDVF